MRKVGWNWSGRWRKPTGRLNWTCAGAKGADPACHRQPIGGVDPHQLHDVPVQGRGAQVIVQCGRRFDRRVEERAAHGRLVVAYQLVQGDLCRFRRAQRQRSSAQALERAGGRRRAGRQRRGRRLPVRGDRAAEGARLESVCSASYRGFESHSLRLLTSEYLGRCQSG